MNSNKNMNKDTCLCTCHCSWAICNSEFHTTKTCSHCSPQQEERGEWKLTTNGKVTALLIEAGLTYDEAGKLVDSLLSQSRHELLERVEKEVIGELDHGVKPDDTAQIFRNTARNTLRLEQRIALDRMKKENHEK
jgi:hypothetical protein